MSSAAAADSLIADESHAPTAAILARVGHAMTQEFQRLADGTVRFARNGHALAANLAQARKAQHSARGAADADSVVPASTVTASGDASFDVSVGGLFTLQHGA